MSNTVSTLMNFSTEGTTGYVIELTEINGYVSGAKECTAVKGYAKVYTTLEAAKRVAAKFNYTKTNIIEVS